MASSNQNASKFAPVYKPVNTKEPTEIDKLIDGTLAVYMEKEMKIASDEEMRRRDAILVEVKQIFLKWVSNVAMKELNVNEDEAEEIGGHPDIFISGSHRLGIRDIGADIDAVCIAPNFCTREHFFTLLKEDFLNHNDVTDLIAIETATVPVISFDFRKVSIDLLFVRLADNYIPKDLDILDDRILVGLDAASEKSLNGPRVTNMVPALIAKNALQNFRVVLRCIRKWAKNRGIYGNKLGYLGGVNCNLLVALVCQLYPNASPSTLLQRFFFLYEGWQWPKPVQLNNIQENPSGETRDTWVPNQYQVMPIITPAYPAMNSTANVSENTLEVMKIEFKRGKKMMEIIISERGSNWERLFEPSDFFIRYQHYLCCHIIAPDNDETSRSWIGFVESRIRQFTTTKFLGSLPLKLPIHLFPVVSKTTKSDNSVCYFIGFNIDTARTKLNKNLYLEDCINRYTDSLFDPDRGFRNNKKEGLEFFVEHYVWKRLPAEVFTTIGGRDVAKAKRVEYGYGGEKKIIETIPIVSTDISIAIESKDIDNKTIIESEVSAETKDNIENDETIKLESSTRKRSLSEANVTIKFEEDKPFNKIPKLVGSKPINMNRPLNIPEVFWL